MTLLCFCPESKVLVCVKNLEFSEIPSLGRSFTVHEINGICTDACTLRARCHETFILLSFCSIAQEVNVGKWTKHDVARTGTKWRGTSCIKRALLLLPCGSVARTISLSWINQAQLLAIVLVHRERGDRQISHLETIQFSINLSRSNLNYLVKIECLCSFEGESRMIRLNIYPCCRNSRFFRASAFGQLATPPPSPLILSRSMRKRDISIWQLKRLENRRNCEQQNCEVDKSTFPPQIVTTRKDSTQGWRSTKR